METGPVVVYLGLLLIIGLWVRRRLLARLVEHVSESEAIDRARTGRAVLVDVRTGAERSRRTLEGSLHVPLHQIGMLPERLGQQRSGKEVIFFCATGSRSLTAAIRARRHGLTVAHVGRGIG